MTHRIAFFVFVLAVLLAGCRALQVDRAAVVSADDWLTEGATPERTHAYPGPVAPPLQELWDYNAGAGFGAVSPLIVGETVLVATRKGEVHAIDLSTGRKAGMNDFGEAVEGTPVVLSGTLYVPLAWGRRVLYAYDLALGRTRWRVEGDPIQAGVLALPGSVVVADAGGHVRALAPSDGSERWAHALEEGRGVVATPVLAGGRILVADDQGGVAALDPGSGALSWARQLDAPVYAAFAADAEAAYLPTTRGRFYALDAATGAVRWRMALPDTTVHLGPPALQAGLLVFGASDGVVRALDAATGAVAWTTRLPDALTAPPLITPEWVYVGTMGRELIALRRSDGEVRWQYTLRGRVKSAMAAREGHLVVLAEPRFVHYFKSASVPDDVATR